MGDFVTAANLASYLQNDVDTASANLAITQAEALVRGYTRQTITTATSTAALLPINVGPAGYTVELPQRPVTAVTTVAVSGVTYVDGVDYAWDGTSNYIRLSVVEESTDSFAAAPVASVTYTHGYATAPGDVVAVALAVAICRQMGWPLGARAEWGSAMPRASATT